MYKNAQKFVKMLSDNLNWDFAKENTQNSSLIKKVVKIQRFYDFTRKIEKIHIT